MIASATSAEPDTLVLVDVIKNAGTTAGETAIRSGVPFARVCEALTALKGLGLVQRGPTKDNHATWLPTVSQPASPQSR